MRNILTESAARSAAFFLVSKFVFYITSEQFYPAALKRVDHSMTLTMTLTMTSTDNDIGGDSSMLMTFKLYVVNMNNRGN